MAESTAKKRAKKQGKMQAGKKFTEKNNSHDTTDINELTPSKNEDGDTSTRPAKKAKAPMKLTAYMDIINPPHTSKSKLTTDSTHSSSQLRLPIKSFCSLLRIAVWQPITPRLLDLSTRISSHGSKACL
jgi:hypothetical protein